MDDEPGEETAVAIDSADRPGSGLELDGAPSRPPMPWIAALGTWLLAALVFFRGPVFSGFDDLTGESGDFRLVVFLHEHWWDVVRGEVAWRSPAFYHPFPGGLGYSYSFALSQIVYVPLRAIGVDQWAAFQTTLIAFTLVGFLAVVALARCHFGLTTATACLLALPVAFANNLYLGTPSPQIYAAQIIPLVVFLAVRAWSNRSRRSGAALAFGSGTLLALLLWSAYYFGWFAILLGAVWLLSAAIVLAVAGRFGAAWHSALAHWRLAMSWVAGFVLGLVPFVLTYVSVLGESTPRTYDEIADFAPRPGDLLNVGGDNVVWGGVVGALLGHDERLDVIYRAVAVTPVLSVLVIVAAGAVVWSWWRSGELGAPGVVTLASAVTFVFALVLPIQFGFGGLWAWTSRFVPGGQAIRVYGRIGVVAGFVAVLALAAWLARRSTSTGGAQGEQSASGSRTGRARLAVLAVLAFLAIEQLNTSTLYRDLDRSDEIARLDAVPPPPTRCRSFYVVDPVDDDGDWTQIDDDRAQIDAMLIAHRVDLPTLNGWSGQRPPGWGFRPITADDYAEQVSAWIEQWNLDPAHVCAYDLAAGEWLDD